MYLEEMFGRAEIPITFYMYLVLFLKVEREIFVMAECLAKLCSAIMWKAELLFDKLGHIFGESSKQSTGGSAWVLAVYSKMSKNSVT